MSDSSHVSHGGKKKKKKPHWHTTVGIKRVCGFVWAKNTLLEATSINS